MNSITKRLSTLEAKRTDPAKAFEAELRHQLSRKTPEQLAHDVGVFERVLQRLEAMNHERGE